MNWTLTFAASRSAILGLVLLNISWPSTVVAGKTTFVLVKEKELDTNWRQPNDAFGSDVRRVISVGCSSHALPTLPPGFAINTGETRATAQPLSIPLCSAQDLDGDSNIDPIWQYEFSSLLDLGLWNGCDATVEQCNHQTTDTFCCANCGNCGFNGCLCDLFNNLDPAFAPFSYNVWNATVSLTGDLQTPDGSRVGAPMSQRADVPSRQFSIALNDSDNAIDNSPDLAFPKSFLRITSKSASSTAFVGNAGSTSPAIGSISERDIGAPIRFALDVDDDEGMRYTNTYQIDVSNAPPQVGGNSTTDCASASVTVIAKAGDSPTIALAVLDPDGSTNLASLAWRTVLTPSGAGSIPQLPAVGSAPTASGTGFAARAVPFPSGLLKADIGTWKFEVQVTDNDPDIPAGSKTRCGTIVLNVGAAPYDGGFVPPCGEGDPACTCSGLHQFDPVNVASGNSFVRIQDASLAGTIGSTELMRTYVSDDAAWAHENAVAGLPKPFGASPSHQDSLRWWHNYYSFVRVEGNFWSVRDADGRTVPYLACSPPCWASPTAGNQSQRERLHWSGSVFSFVRSDGSRLEFQDKWHRTAANQWDAYFLTRVKDVAGRTTQEVAYEFPSNVTCPSTGSALTQAPYLKTVATPEGTQLVFKYSSMSNAHGLSECVISRVAVRNKHDPLQTETVVLDYSYVDPGTTAAQAGLIRSAKWPSQTSSNATVEETYSYSSGLERKIAGTAYMQHSYSAGSVSSITALNETVTMGSPTALTSCPSGLNCCGNLPNERRAEVTSALDGAGAGVTAGLSRSFKTVSNYNQALEPRVLEITDSCTSSGACSPGSERFDWSCSTPEMPGRLIARRDKRDKWSVFTYAPAPSGKSPQFATLARVRHGASDNVGTGDLVDENYEYVYGKDDVELLRRRWSLSVVGGGRPNRREERHAIRL